MPISILGARIKTRIAKKVEIEYCRKEFHPISSNIMRSISFRQHISKIPYLLLLIEYITYTSLTYSSLTLQTNLNESKTNSNSSKTSWKPCKCVMQVNNFSIRDKLKK